MARATSAERERLNETFAQLCRIESPSGRERACADWVTAQLQALGLEVSEDDAGPEVGSDAGNLLARIPGPDGAGSVLLCAHLDTVPLADRVEPELVDGGWENARDGILGADNKSAVAILLEISRRLTSAAPPPVGVELLFTVCEEVSLLGSRAFDVSRLHSSFGYVFDHATAIGELVVASPTHYRVTADVHGHAAHAGVRPEAGRSAILAAARGIAKMRLGRIDERTTANVGTIDGGSAINVVPERCRVIGEVRSLDEERAAAVTTEMIDHLQDGADGEECDLDLTVERMFRGYRLRPGAPQLAVARRALAACGYEPREIASGGASDVNSLVLNGFPSICLADGVQRNHEPTERIAVDALEGMFEVALTLLDEAAAELARTTVTA